MQGPERYGWSDPTHERPKVLIEHPDHGVGAIAQRVLTREGFDVATCEGPSRRRPCPVVQGRPCSLADQADVIVHGLSLEPTRQGSVLAALRERRPDVPIVVEATRPELEEHAALLLGCLTIPFPMTRAALVDAVRTAAAQASSSNDPVDVDRRGSWLVHDGEVVDCPRCDGEHVVFTHHGEPPVQLVDCPTGTYPVGIENRRIPPRT